MSSSDGTMADDIFEPGARWSEGRKPEIQVCSVSTQFRVRYLSASLNIPQRPESVHSACRLLLSSPLAWVVDVKAVSLFSQLALMTG
ncbi:unnamed protein product [Protopolystoma xenopodis]|uniref:Uncharacterized protein n=1 Tax=Protopolystoma xenopodis TaxID=117903 RepID=A0A448X4S2_9PLAT|nr:unnamed protein product [Protopolystoma xenopodis]